jgi:hypothetical protein
LQLGARHPPDGDVGVARYLKYLAQARLVRALGHGQTLDGPRPRAQGFEHGLDAEEVRAVVFNYLLTSCGLARLPFRKAPHRVSLAPRPEGARHTVARRLYTAAARSSLSLVRANLASA